MKREEQKSAHNPILSRRTFLKASAAAAAVTGAVSATPWSGMKALAAADKNVPAASKETLVASVCRSNCFQCCRLDAHVRDGKIVKTTPAPYPDEIYTGCCLKGLALVQRTYSPTRIKYPMRRVGKRGEDKWERISWDTAISEIAEKFTAVQTKYGPEALVFDIGSGDYGFVNGCLGMYNRLANSLGASKLNVCYDQATGHGTDRVIGGGVWLWGSEPMTILDAKKIIVWGSNPVYSTPQNWRLVKEAQKKGAKVIDIDVIYSATANKSDEFIPIVPGSDLMLALAMTNYIISHNLTNIPFMKARTTAPFLVRKDNGKILRKSDFVKIDPKEDDFYVWDSVAGGPALLKDKPKDVALEGTYNVQGVDVETVFTLLKHHVKQYTVEKASELTKIPAKKIEYLAKTYADGPTMVYTNYGIDHYQNGHLWAFTALIMASITGNIGVKGAGFVGNYVMYMPLNYKGAFFTNGKMATSKIPQTIFHQVAKEQSLAGKPYPVKAMLTFCSNSMSNMCQQNLWFTDILPNIDFSVVIDFELTDTARHADIVLPAAFWLEVDDLRVSYNNPYMMMQEKAIEPLFESKPPVEIFGMIARKMGLEKFFPKGVDDIYWVKMMLDTDDLRKMNVTYDRLKAEKAVRVQGTSKEPYIRGEKFFLTKSAGRAQLYAEVPLPRVNYGQDLTELTKKERLPYFKTPGEAWNKNPLFKKYPLVFIQEHSRYRVHSQWFNTPMLRELDPEPLARISRKDAKARNIKTGDIVEVFNDRGKAVVKAEVNDSISPGVLSIPKGWQREQFIKGCYQELTNTTSDPMAVNFAFFDCLVDVKKV